MVKRIQQNSTYLAPTKLTTKHHKFMSVYRLAIQYKHIVQISKIQEMKSEDQIYVDTPTSKNQSTKYCRSKLHTT